MTPVVRCRDCAGTGYVRITGQSGWRMVRCARCNPPMTAARRKVARMMNSGGARFPDGSGVRRELER